MFDKVHSTRIIGNPVVWGIRVLATNNFEGGREIRYSLVFEKLRREEKYR